MGPEHNASRLRTIQGTVVRRPRRRLCLLKDCESGFSPVHALSRYCSEACRQAACRWSRWRAARAYRSTDTGKQVRREQSRRYRQRVRERPQKAHESSEDVCRDASEGHHKDVDSKKIACSRPGCYEVFPASDRFPLKTFCTAICCQALRRVRRREVHWLRSSRSAPREGVPWPPDGVCRPHR